MDRVFEVRRDEEPAPRSRSAGRRASPAAGATTEVLADRWRLDRLLGVGGEAEVWAAHDLRLDRDVAVKLFHDRESPSVDGLLRQVEARVIAAMHHSALTALFDTGIDEGPQGVRRLFLVMEYVPGETLAARLQRGPMEPSEACWLTFDIAEGLDSMHQAGFLHRDVKPGNILLSSARSARPVVAKLTDFGIAARVGEPDLSEFTVGTAAYLSPEQVEGFDARPESDVYSLGLVLLEAITGRPEFGGTVAEAAFARLSRDPRIPASVPPRIGALILRMTVRAPAERISLHEAALELQQILVDDLVRRRGEQIQAAPTAPSPRVALEHADQVRRDYDPVLQLAAAAAGAPKVLLLLGPMDEAVLAADVGWPQPPAHLVAAALAVLAPTSDGRVAAIADLQQRAGAADPLLQDGVRGAAVVGLVGSAGVIGALYAFDPRPGGLGDGGVTALRATASVIERDLQLRAAIRRILFPGD